MILFGRTNAALIKIGMKTATRRNTAADSPGLAGARHIRADRS